MANYWISIGASLTPGLGLLVVMVSAWPPKRELRPAFLMDRLARRRQNALSQQLPGSF